VHSILPRPTTRVKPTSRCRSHPALSQTPAQQIGNYQQWLGFYNLPSRMASDMTPAEQSAMIQGLQFAPNSNAWLNIVGGNLNARATTAPQAPALGNTSFQQMLNYYNKFLGSNPATYAAGTLPH
jgi:hypothetical protein